MPRPRFIRLAALVGALLGVAGACLAQELTEEQREEAIAFAEANTTFVLLHEVGHMLVDQFEIPILGREEDAVDNLATLLLLWQETDEADNALIDAAYGWFLSDASETADFQASDFYDEHRLDLQRGYSIICKMIGTIRSCSPIWPTKRTSSPMPQTPRDLVGELCRQRPGGIFKYRELP